MKMVGDSGVSGLGYEGDSDEVVRPDFSDGEGVSSALPESTDDSLSAKKEKKKFDVSGSLKKHKMVVIACIAVLIGAAGYMLIGQDDYSTGQAADSDAAFAMNQGYTPAIEETISTDFNTEDVPEPSRPEYVPPVVSSIDDVVVPPAPAVASVASGMAEDDVLRIVEQAILASMSGDKEKLNGVLFEVGVLDKNLSELRADVGALKSSLVKLDIKYGALLSKVKKLKPRKKRVYKRSSKTKAKAVPKSVKRPVYTLSAYVGGRAWIKKKGQASLVVIIEGDILKGYGEILSISPSGVINTKAGLVKTKILR